MSGKRPRSRLLWDVPERLFEDMAHCAAGAMRAEAVEEDWDMGGVACRVRFSSGELKCHLARALEPRGAFTGSPRWYIDVWEDCLAPLPELHPVLRQRVAHHVLEMGSDGEHLAVDEDWLGTHTFVSRRERRALYCVGDLDALPYYERAAPLRALWRGVLSAEGRCLAHAAAVGNRRGALLMPGAAGAGKSSTALTGLLAGMDHLADDWCGVKWEGEPEVFRVYQTAKLRPENRQRFAELGALVENEDRLDEEKAVLFLGEQFGGRMPAVAPLRAVVLPVVGEGQESRWERASGQEAWKALVSCTLAQIPGNDRETAAGLMRVCARVPVYRLKLGREREGVAVALREILEKG